MKRRMARGVGRGVDSAAKRVRRRWMLGAFYGAAAVAILLAWPAFGQVTAPDVGDGTAATAPVVSPTAAAQAKAQFEKAKALYTQDKFAEAQVENQKALRLDPANSDAILLATVLSERLAAAGTAGKGGQAGRSGAPGKFAVLTEPQMSMIRLMELSSADRSVRGKIDRSTLEDFWQEVISKDRTIDASPQAHSAFLNPSNFMAQVRAIKDSGEAKFMNQVTITSDPAVLRGAQNSFTQVQNYALQNCATADCHGGEKAGAFRLFPNNTAGVSAEQQLYTNFYIMAMYKDQAGKMVDRESPEKSLLITYSLPKGHPTVSIPAKMQPNDVQYRRVIDWIRSLAFPQPNYGITFDVGKAATAPADEGK